MNYEPRAGIKFTMGKKWEATRKQMGDHWETSRNQVGDLREIFRRQAGDKSKMTTQLGRRSRKKGREMETTGDQCGKAGHNAR